MTTNQPGVPDEAERIREAYAKRENRGRYSFFNKAYLLALQEVERELLFLMGRALDRAGSQDLSQTRALDVGCGGGYWLRRMIDWGVDPANAHGLDLLPDRVERALTRLPAACDIRQADARAIPWPDGHFGLVSQFVMFSSVLSREVRAAIASEMLRVAAPGGLILWYDFHVDNPRNPDVKGVRMGEVRRLFPGAEIEARRVTVAPPLARVLLPRFAVVYNLVRLVPGVRTHWVAVIRKGA
ncbi:MAG: class I SAM-dependent methyltransferase [bacterium]|nr:class I SAM-dependent methyltransferase [bacterium]